MPNDDVRPLAEITDLERAAALGAPTFAATLKALLARWRLPLCDSETATRLLFAIHEGHTEQMTFLNVGPAALPDAAQVLAEAGGEPASWTTVGRSTSE